MPPRLARLLALLAALALVGGAFVLRGALGDDGDVTTAGGPGGTGGGSTAPSGNGGPYRLLCDDDLGDACAALRDLDGVASVEVVRAAEAVTALTGEEGHEYDAWLTLDPWPAIVAGLIDPSAAPPDVVPVASAPLAVVVDPAPSECEGPSTDWECLAGTARPPVGIASLDSAAGPLLLAHAATGLQGTAEFGINQIEDPVRDALEDLLRAVGREGGRSVSDQANRILLPGTFSAVVAPRGQAAAVAGSRQGETRDLTVTALSPGATVGVVLAGVGPRGAAALDALRGLATDQTVLNALATEGWDGPPARTEGLPDPDVIYALKETLG